MKKYIISIITLLIVSCKPDIESPTWTIDVIAPIAKTELQLTDLLQDNNVDIDTSSDESLTLVYSINTIDTNLNDFISEEDLKFDYDDNLLVSSFTKPPIDISYEITLGELIDGTALQGQLIHGTFVPIPQFTIAGNTFDIGLIPDFFELEVKSANIQITIINNLPTAIDGFSFGVNNKIFPTTNICFFPSLGVILQDDSVVYNELLLGLITNSLQINTTSFSFLGNSNPTTIDTSKGLEVKIKITDILLHRIYGEIEEEILLEEQEDSASLYFDELVIKKVKVDSGKIVININNFSTLDAPVMAEFISSSILQQGNPIAPIILTLNTTSTSEEIDISGMEINFIVDGDSSFFPFELNCYIPPTTINSHISEIDFLEYSVSAFMKPKYIIADVKHNIIEIATDTFVFDFFSELEIENNNLSVELVKLNIGVVNYLGIDCDFYLDVKSENTTNGTFQNYNNTFSIASAHFDPNTENAIPIYQDILFNDLSNIVNIQPNEITIGGEILLNSGYNNFIVYDQGITITPSIEVPLSFIAKELVLNDTTNTEFSDDLDGTSLKMIVDNGYPINTTIELKFLNEYDLVLDNFSDNIPAGLVNSNGRVVNPTRSIVDLNVNDDILKNVRKINYVATFETSSQVVYNKIYSDYKIAVQLIGEHKTTIGE